MTKANKKKRTKGTKEKPRGESKSKLRKDLAPISFSGPRDNGRHCSGMLPWVLGPKSLLEPMLNNTGVANCR